jgi:DNA-binding response OmpR family regulator
MIRTTAAGTLRVLVVDDRPDARPSLEAAGFAVTTVATAREAMKIAGGFDVAVVEQRLPDARGVALVRWLHRRFPALRIVMYSASADWDLFFRARGVGAEDVVAKMLTARELVRVVSLFARR